MEWTAKHQFSKSDVTHLVHFSASFSGRLNKAVLLAGISSSADRAQKSSFSQLALETQLFKDGLYEHATMLDTKQIKHKLHAPLNL